MAFECILYILEQSPPGPLPLDAMQEEHDTLKNEKMMTYKHVALYGLLWAMKFIGNMKSTLMQRKSYFTYKSCLVNKVGLLDMRYLSGFLC